MASIGSGGRKRKGSCAAVFKMEEGERRLLGRRGAESNHAETVPEGTNQG